MRRWIGQLAAIVLILAPNGALAQRAVLVGENDAIVNTDRDYTSGFRLSIVFDDFNRDLLAGQMFGAVRPALLTFGAPGGAVRQQFEWIALAQNIYTPDRDTRGTYVPGVDRPFGGWLYTGFSIAQETARRQLDSFELQVGAVGGNASLGQAVQSSFHRMLGQSTPVINGYELRNEPGIAVSWERRWKFATDFGQGFGADIIPSLGFTGGNVFTYGEAGAIVRVGRALSTNWGPTLVRPGVSGANFVSPDPAAPFWGFSLFGGVQARGVARNIFLDGSTFADSPHVTRESFVYDLVAGAEVFNQAGFLASLTWIHRSREYTTQTRAYSDYGSVTLAYHF
ncbi:lipid A deacylase LpxR family protein [Rhodopseudomonas palustris]|uniref:Lipid A deacylase LpxR family protein n=1 Tax=Rhodopseudomonas palustris TaxID=1076 RepID=A0A418VIP0_RHOPL|nr:lipid A deacylase LpxR family protein [Rhodopseudomonas palustris]RJF76008.1 lipid A deacylase LpxR family protein [Rhodopseudomonas palustris]